MSSRTYVWPVGNENTVTSNFGWRTDPFTGERAWHNGVDIAYAGINNEPFVATANGVVTTVVNSTTGGYGKYIVVTHDDGRTSLYAHNAENLVQVGQIVKAGDTIGLVGNTGRSTAPHLHFEIKEGTNPVNPLNLLKDVSAPSKPQDWDDWSTDEKVTHPDANKRDHILDSADREGAELQEQRYYIKLQHVGDDENPESGFTLKITPSGEFIMTREKLFMKEPSPESNRAEEGSDDGVVGGGSQLPPEPNDPGVVGGGAHLPDDVEEADAPTVAVEKAESIQFQEHGMRIEYHNTGQKSDSEPKLFNEMEMDDNRFIIQRRKIMPDGEETFQRIVVIDDNITMDIFKEEDKRTRIEMIPNRILIKNDDKSYVLVDGDLIHAKNKSGSEISMQGITIAAVNKYNESYGEDLEGKPMTRMFIRGKHAEFRVIEEGTMVAVSNQDVIAYAPNDIRATADRDVIIHAGRDITATAENNITATAENDIKAFAERNINAVAQNDLDATAVKGNLNLTAGKVMNLTATTINITGTSRVNIN